MHHVPILVKQFLAFFEGKTLHTYVDGTIGAGGHAHAILLAHPEIERFYGLDRDPEALEIAKERLEEFGDKVHLIHGNYHELEELVPEESLDGTNSSRVLSRGFL